MAVLQICCHKTNLAVQTCACVIPVRPALNRGNRYLALQILPALGKETQGKTAVKCKQPQPL